MSKSLPLSVLIAFVVLLIVSLPAGIATHPLMAATPNATMAATDSAAPLTGKIAFATDRD
ncbi:MAG: hypothetical protein IT324_34050, partial [Anaerolineae bacterium]|nr:hypothetical protein [Anaerolineae bacterium]